MGGEIGQKLIRASRVQPFTSRYLPHSPLAEARFMFKQAVCIVALCAVTALAAEPPAAVPLGQPTTVPSRISAVTVFEGNALITREVAVPEGAGLMDLIVTPLPEQVVDTSLFTEGTDGLRVLSTRFRTRAVQEDTRAAVRDRQDQIKTLQADSEKITRDIAAEEQDLALVTKLENFTSATMATMTDKGALNAEATVALTKFIMATRGQTTSDQVILRQKLAANCEQIEFLQRQLNELTVGSSRTERDAIITIDKAAAGADAKIRLNYLVGAVNWQPQYKIHAGTDQDAKVHVEYLASLQQQTGEDWPDVDISLSTAEPMLDAAPPELLALELTVGAPGNGAGGGGSVDFSDNASKSQVLRQEAQKEANGQNHKAVREYLNSASALEQSNELLLGADKETPAPAREGPSVTFHLPTHYSVPSRSDQQLIEVARLDLNPSYFYKAVPVLTPHVYRQANMLNDSGYVLLPGDATMYVGKDFVGRMNLPLVAIGDSFAAGFGVDPQVQVDRKLVSKTETTQGGNQVHTYEFRIRISNLKQEKVAIQVWDRLPKADSESVGVTLLAQTPPLSTDAQYLREDRPKNLLRWDMTVDKGATGETAGTIDYQFKLEFARDVSVGNFKVTY
jgi:uncharacterized protein (TIGR02231 family)